MSPQATKLVIRITMSLGLLFAVTAGIICIADLLKRPIKSLDPFATPLLGLALCSMVIAIALSSMLRKRGDNSGSGLT